MKPLLQLFALDLLRIPEFTDRQNSIKESNNKKILTYEMEIEKLKEKWNEPEKLKKKLALFQSVFNSIVGDVLEFMLAMNSSITKIQAKFPPKNHKLVKMTKIFA